MVIWLLAIGRWEHHNSLAGGVTSLQENLPHRSEGNLTEVEVFAGTKRGVVLRLVLKGNSVGTSATLSDPSSKSSFPIYSMAVDSTSSDLFCGGGDRHVTVWSMQGGQMKMKQRLGPHTGWVKDVLYDVFSRQLHSIGCNCIEIWRKSPSDACRWTHFRKVHVESCAKMGSTLSSDLLCLCACSNGSFFAGGVDGRIHLWDSASSSGEPIISISAHDGRVNALAFDASSSLLFSGSHDGKIKCWHVETSSPHLLTLLVETSVSGKDSRVMSLAHCVDPHDESSKAAVKLFFGTQNGLVGAASVRTEAGEGETVIAHLGHTILPDKPTVNALVVVPVASKAPLKKRFQILAGHSAGMTLLTYKETVK